MFIALSISPSEASSSSFKVARDTSSPVKVANTTGSNFGLELLVSIPSLDLPSDLKTGISAAAVYEDSARVPEIKGVAEVRPTISAYLRRFGGGESGIFIVRRDVKMKGRFFLCVTTTSKKTC